MGKRSSNVVNDFFQDFPMNEEKKRKPTKHIVTKRMDESALAEKYGCKLKKKWRKIKSRSRFHVKDELQMNRFCKKKE